jgi:enterobacterial common antigen flippase
VGDEKSYAQILKSSSIMGGAAGITLLLGMVRVKFAAVLIGTTGVGLNASFSALQGVVGTLAGLGIQSSGVREIAAAIGKGDDPAVGRAVLTVLRISWLTGLLGLASMIVLGPLLSQLTFGNAEYALDIAALGLVVLFGNLAGGRMALLQGARRIGDMAQANIAGAVFGTVAAIGFYATLGLRGIIPTLVAVAAFQYALSWYFARRIPVPHVTMTLRQTLAEAGSMVRLGLVFMSTGLMGSAVTYLTVALVTQYEGVQGVGLYSAAFALSGMFVNFVLGAMGADYYPRLTAVAGDPSAMNRLVNEQTEIGLLLALPGLLATLALAPWILQLFYTREFLGAVALLQWFILGCIGRVISWPLGFVMLALGKGRWFLLTDISFHVIHIGLIALGLKWFGLEGVAIAFLVMYLGYIVAVHGVSRRLTGFMWSKACSRIALFALPVLVATFTASRTLSLWPASLIGLSLAGIVGVLSVRAIVVRVGKDHRIVRAIARLPGMRTLRL